MITIARLEKTCSMCEIALMINSPSTVKGVKLLFEFKRYSISKEKSILMGDVNICVKTYSGSFILDWWSVPPTLEDSDIDKIKEEIIYLTEDFLNEWLERRGYENFWDLVDFDREEWKIKEE